MASGNRMRHFLSPVLFLLSSLSFAELAPPLWDDSYGRAHERVLARMETSGEARNIILFIGDGMSLATVTAARILEGQRRGQSGEENFLSFEGFAHTGFAKTWNVDSQVPDSAGTATAILSGIKARMGVVGLDARVDWDSCEGIAASRVPTLLEMAEARGLKTGIVTTTALTHATPAATYAHVSNRNWQADAPCGLDIASQFLEFSHGDGIEVALGGGRQAFEERPDDMNLIANWRTRHPSGQFVTTRAALLAADSTPVLGLFSDSHMAFEADRGATQEPSLAEMTRAAIRHLNSSGRGFFLLVEGGRIDHAHHDSNAYRALTDTLAFSEAVTVALELTNAQETLMIVTADHGHVFTMGGYPVRGNPILGLVKDETGELERDIHGHPYTTLSYGNGPGDRESSNTLQEEDARAPDFVQPAAIVLDTETHSGEDVPVYAQGPGAEAVRGVMEQNELFHVMKLALFGEEDT